jgi:hypothetical protein
MNAWFYAYKPIGAQLLTFSILIRFDFLLIK